MSARKLHADDRARVDTERRVGFSSQSNRIFCPHNQVSIVMAESGKDRIGGQTAELRVTFDMALSNRGKYPVAEFKAFVQSAQCYIKDRCWPIR